MNKYCENCGKKLDKKSGLCPVCDAEKLSSGSYSKKSVKPIVVILCVVLVFALVIGTAFALPHLNKGGKSEVQDEKPIDVPAQEVNSSNYTVGKGIIYVGGKFICADSNALYLKSSVQEKGEVIADVKNVDQLMSNGETVYFTATHDDYSYSIYTVSTDGENLTELLNSKNVINLVTVEGEGVYYIDCEFESGKLKRYDSNTKEKEVVLQAQSACRLGKKIYYSMEFVGQNVDLIDKNTVEAYDLESGATEVIAQSSTLLGSMCTDEALYFSSFDYEYDYNHPEDAYSDLYVYTIDKDNNVTKSEKLPDGCRLDHISADGQFAILAKNDGVTNMGYYQYNFGTKNMIEIPSGTFAYGMFENDLMNKSDVYCIGFSANSTGATSTVSISKIAASGSSSCKVGGQEYIEIDGYTFYFVDGKFLDKDLNVYEITAG